MLTGKQKRYLRSLAETQPALFQIGKDGLSDNLIMTVNNAFNTRELVKVKLLQSVADDPKEIGFDLAMYTHSELVQIIGRTILLYKKGKKPEIILP
ncbi:MAG: ribosome assembly RNA-binding protein YhbY [Solobacterium sp.]|nr:ribosome assembly RNA-binding protein YhbY [Solobacterium sp.]MBR2829315.1 ribosome assembly RNA-binding protein YhbY [Solobacterium sp.]MBR3127858.1 ribosome assembly RNA-binding protein YhbY [Solobacterium sp.]